MKKILVLVPHRSADGMRNESLKKLIASWRETTDGFSDILVGLDRDDIEQWPVDLEADVIQDVNEIRLNVIKKINYLSSKYGKKYDYIYFVGNDCIFRTKGWETIFLNSSVGMKHVVYYGNDMLQSERLCTHAFLSMNIIEDVGFMGPECLNHMFVDNFWMAIGNYLGCLRYFPEVVLEHMHYANGKNSKDKMYAWSDAFYNQDQVSFVNYMQTKFVEDMKRIK